MVAAPAGVTVELLTGGAPCIPRLGGTQPPIGLERLQSVPDLKFVHVRWPGLDGQELPVMKGRCLAGKLRPQATPRFGQAEGRPRRPRMRVYAYSNWETDECERCKTLLRPKAGDCCVFCSYGSVKCPPVQARGSSCQGGCL